MKYSISNIAWDVKYDKTVLDLMNKFSFNAVEIAPSKIWPQPLQASKNDISTYRKFWNSNGIDIVAMQALLYGHAELTIFDNETSRNNTIKYLKSIIDIANGLGAKILIFGSPKNRLIKELPIKAANDIAASFFYQLGEYAEKHDTCICIEPNPTDYGCDFITDSTQAYNLVKQVNQPGFGLHLDLAALQMSHENITTVIAQYENITQHFHISEPFLNPIGSGDIDHQLAAKTIKASNYNKCLSIEMRASEGDHVLPAIETALNLVHKYYQ